METVRGACLCSELRFELALPSKWVAHCHCSMCRRAHGAAFVTWLGADAAGSVIDDPADRLRWYASSAEAERGFCARCGSTLFFRSSRWPGELHVAVANLLGPADRPPSMHVSWDDHVDWASIDPQDGLPRKGGVG
jgi:hypothetical protein